MTQMFHDMEEAVVRTRIRKFRDEKSHPKNRLVEAAVLVDLVERILNTPTEDEAPESPAEPDFGPSRGDNPPPGEDDEPEPAKRTGLLGKIFK